MKKIVRVWIVCVIATCFGTAVAQTEQQETTSPEKPYTGESSVFSIDVGSPDDPPVEEIIVLGEKTDPQIRREIRVTELEIIDLFNASNLDNDYDILCRKETRVGSQIPRTNCKARIYWEALSELAQDSEDAVRTNRPLMTPARHADVLRSKMLEQAEQNPKLLQALVRRKLLQRELQGRKADQDIPIQ